MYRNNSEAVWLKKATCAGLRRAKATRLEDFPAYCRLTGLVLAACLLLVLLTACGGASGKSYQGTLSAETTRIGSETLALDLGAYPLRQEAECRITPVDSPPALEGAEIQAYSFEIDTEEELLSVMELTIPYDADALNGQSPAGNIAAAYYNQETAQWEPVPFRVNQEAQTITIYTDHLSVYGCFEVTDPNTREAYAAYAIPAFAMIGVQGMDADAIITNAVLNGGAPAEDAIDAGLSIMDSVLNFSSAGVDTSAYLAGISGSSGAATSSLLGDIGERMGQLGLLCSIAQVSYGMYNIYNGDTDAVFPCYANALKGIVGYTAGKLGARLYSLAFVGVLAVEYSINSFAEEAWSGRKDIYQEAYALYYASHDVKRSARDWAEIFIQAKATASSAERYQLRVDGLVQRYVEQFWEDETTVAEYQSQAQEQGFTGGGGLNERIKAEISADYKLELFRGVLQDAFKLIAEKEAMAAERALLAELNAIRQELNQTCTLELYDATVSDEQPVSDAAGAKVAVTLPDSVIDAESWSVTLNERGEGRIQFTLLGYLMAGAPTELKVYEKEAPETAEPKMTLPFVMETASVRVDVGIPPLSLAELAGRYDGTMTITEVFISDALMQRAAENPLQFDEEKLEFYGDCDAQMLVALKDAVGQVTECTIVIEATAEATDACTIKLIPYSEDDDWQIFSSHYDNGLFTPENEWTYFDGFNVQLLLTAEKTESGSIQLNGSYLGVLSEYPDDVKITFAISAAKAD